MLARELATEALILLALLKLAPGNTNLADDLQILRGDLKALLEGPDGLRDFRLALTYIIRVGDADPAALEAFIDQLGPDAKEAFMTTAERLEARGELNGAAKILLEMLSLKFGPAPEHVVNTVRAGTIEQLQGWTADALTAERLDQVF